MNAKMIIGICLVVFIVAGLIVLRLTPQIPPRPTTSSWQKAQATQS